MTEQLQPSSETFTHRGRTVKVTMVIPTPENVSAWTSPPTKTPGVERAEFYPTNFTYSLPLGKVTKPVVVFGVYCPAGFVVEGLPFYVGFSIRRNKESSDRTRDVVIGGLDIRAGDLSGVSSEMLESIPAAKLLAAALNAAAVTLVAYPPNYYGPRLTLADGGSLVPVPDTTLQTGEDVRAFPVITGDVEMPSNFPENAAGVPRLVGEQRLREVARIVKGTDATGWTRLVAKRLLIGERHARRLIQEARDAKFLPPLPPTDKRTRRNKS